MILDISGHCDLKFASLQAKIDEYFANYFFFVCVEITRFMMILKGSRNLRKCQFSIYFTKGQTKQIKSIKEI